jgi:tellurite resistance protein TehA-like permease
VKFGSPGFGGPLYLTVVALLLLTLVGAVSVVVDVVRRHIREPGSVGSMSARLTWTVPQVALLVAAVLGLVIPVNVTLSTVIGLLFMVCAAVQIAYLLVVVFPRRRGDDASAEDEADG